MSELQFHEMLAIYLADVSANVCWQLYLCWAWWWRCIWWCHWVSSSGVPCKCGCSGCIGLLLQAVTPSLANWTNMANLLQDMGQDVHRRLTEKSGRSLSGKTTRGVGVGPPGDGSGLECIDLFSGPPVGPTCVGKMQQPHINRCQSLLPFSG